MATSSEIFDTNQTELRPHALVGPAGPRSRLHAQRDPFSPTTLGGPSGCLRPSDQSRPPDSSWEAVAPGPARRGSLNPARSCSPVPPLGAGTLSRAQPSLTRSKCRWEGSHGWGLVFGPDPPLTPVRKEVSWFEAVPFHTMRLRLARQGPETADVTGGGSLPCRAAAPRGTASHLPVR